MLLYAVLLSVSVSRVTQAYPSGPPVTNHPHICETLTPNHNDTLHQTSAAPYELVVSASCYNPGMSLSVAVRQKSGQSANFRGMFVQARASFSQSPTATQGNFSTSDTDLKLLQCANQPDSAIGHSNRADKSCKTFMWDPPTGATDVINFHATIVQDFKTFWVGLVSSPVEYDVNCQLTTSGDLCDSGAGHVIPGFCGALLLSLFLSVF